MHRRDNWLVYGSKYAPVVDKIKFLAKMYVKLFLSLMKNTPRYRVFRERQNDHRRNLLFAASLEFFCLL